MEWWAARRHLEGCLTVVQSFKGVASGELGCGQVAMQLGLPGSLTANLAQEQQGLHAAQSFCHGNFCVRLQPCLNKP